MHVVENKRCISSLEELYKIIDSLITECSGHRGLIYNVCDYENNNLMPSLGRSNRKNIRRVEQELLSTVRVYGGHSLSAHEINDWLLMCLAKKQGFPTRLLEWTDNLNNALWSVCHSQSKDCINIIKLLIIIRLVFLTHHVTSIRLRYSMWLIVISKSNEKTSGIPFTHLRKVAMMPFSLCTMRKNIQTV